LWSTRSKTPGTDASLRDGPFADRIDAGRLLGERMALCQDLPAPVVVALPRGGVPVGAQVARRLGAPLAAMPVGKVGAPGREELAVGAVAPGGVTVLNLDVIAALHLDPDEVEHLVSKAAAKVAHQVELYRRAGQGVPLSGRSVVVVDDGLATGASMRAALIAVRELHPGRVVLAVPVAAPEALESLSALADEQVCVVRPERMEAVGAWYKDFSQTTDAEVARFLGELGAQPAAPAG
jgi:putative phosphoribosyl transferase